MQTTQAREEKEKKPKGQEREAATLPSVEELGREKDKQCIPLYLTAKMSGRCIRHRLVK
jgi:hypothetical protein